MASLNAPLDDWQESALEACMGERADGRWASKYIGISAPRQNGKSQLIVARALAGVLLFGEKSIIVSAHEMDTAREVWKRLIDVIEDNPTLEARVTGRMDAIGREYVSFGRGADRQEIRLKARSKTGGRGFSADCLLLDEAQILDKRTWGAINPTVSARPNPQVWLFGTPPDKDDDPFAFTKVRESGLKHKVRHAWLEWSADDDDDLDDPATWAKANPSFGVRISLEACEDDRANMDDDQFARERLGRWGSLDALSTIFGAAWPLCERDMPADLAMAGFALASTFDLDRTALVGAAVAGDVTHVKPLQSGPGTDWVAARALEIQAVHDVDLVIDPKGPAAVLLPELERAGVRVRVVESREVYDACAGVVETVKALRLGHGAYPELDREVRVAKQRTVGDRWAWDRKMGIPTVEAMTLALWQAGAPVVVEQFVSAYESGGLEVV